MGPFHVLLDKMGLDQMAKWEDPNLDAIVRLLNYAPLPIEPNSQI